MKFRVSPYYGEDKDRPMFVIEAQMEPGHPWRGVVTDNRAVAYPTAHLAQQTVDRLSADPEVSGTYVNDPPNAVH